MFHDMCVIFHYLKLLALRVTGRPLRCFIGTLASGQAHRLSALIL